MSGLNEAARAELIARLRDWSSDHFEIVRGELDDIRRDMRAAAELLAADEAREPADPMDWPLPCDVKVGHGTIAKGCKLRTLVARTTLLYETLQAHYDAPAAQAEQPADRNAARYLWHKARNPGALLANAWGASRAACAIGEDVDAATDVAMGAPAERGEQPAQGLADAIEHAIQRHVGGAQIDDNTHAGMVAFAREVLASAPRVPLTDEQMLACVRSVGAPAPMGLMRDRGAYEVTEPTWFLTQLVRAIERAHGLAAAPQPKGGQS